MIHASAYSSNLFTVIINLHHNKAELAQNRQSQTQHIIQCMHSWLCYNVYAMLFYLHLVLLLFASLLLFNLLKFYQITFFSFL